MESAFDNLQKACAPIVRFRSIRDLPNGNITIDAFRLIKKKFSTRLAVLIRRELYFLPNRFTKFVSSQIQVDELNATHYIMMKKGEDLQFREVFYEAMDEVDG